jgi:hypothetical protein
MTTGMSSFEQGREEERCFGGDGDGVGGGCGGGAGSAHLLWRVGSSEGDNRFWWGTLEIALLSSIWRIIFLGELVANRSKIAHLFGCFLGYLG